MQPRFYDTFTLLTPVLHAYGLTARGFRFEQNGRVYPVIGCGTGRLFVERPDQTEVLLARLERLAPPQEGTLRVSLRALRLLSGKPGTDLNAWLEPLGAFLDSGTLVVQGTEHPVREHQGALHVLLAGTWATLVTSRQELVPGTVMTAHAISQHWAPAAALQQTA